MCRDESLFVRGRAAGPLAAARLGGLALNDVQFVDYVAAAGELVDDEEHVAYVYGDAALQLRLEGYVARHRLPVAVEGEAYEAAVAVEHRRARIAARDVEVGEEAGVDAAVGVGIAAVVLGAVELLELVLDGELLGVPGILLRQHALQRGEVVVRDGVGGVVGEHLTVGEAYGEVGIRVPRPLGLHAHQARDVEAVPLVV